MTYKVIWVTIFSMLLSGCYKIGLYLANTSNADEQYQAFTDIRYGTESWQNLDVYVPHSVGDASAPVVMFFYGGGWSSGDKASYAFVASTLAQHGFITVIPDYVKYPQATYPAFQKDAALASRWVVDHIAEYQGKPDNLHMMGHSAGAHMGAMLLANRQFLEEVKLTPAIFRSFVGLAGPYAFVPKEKKYRAIFGNKDDYSDMQVPNFINGDEPQMLLMHGADDDIVGQFNLQKLADAISANHGQVQTAMIKGLGHIRLIGQFSATLGNDNEVVKRSMAFIENASKDMINE